MSLPATVQVLVVGAGPTGLAAANALAKKGLEVAVVDSTERNHNGSRAAVVHARTLEVLDPIGLAAPLIESGTRTDYVVMRGTTNILFELDLSLLRNMTKFPFSVMIPQHEVERIFREQLPSERVQVFRNKTVIGMRQADDEASGVEVTFEDGNVTRTQYVIGTDGSRSTIRHLAGIEFKDPSTGAAYEDATVPVAVYIVLADVYLEDPLPETVLRDSLTAHLDKFLLLIPLLSHEAGRPSKIWRIAYGMPGTEAQPPKEVTLEYLQSQMDERNPWGVRIKIASMITGSRYKVRAAIADEFFHKLGSGNVLLAGDAAHVHSPAGGQGMNLGICDAVALADAIKSHLDAKDSSIAAATREQRDDILRSYSDSRHRIGLRVLGLTKAMTIFINANKGWRRLLRNFLVRVVSYLPFVPKFVLWRMSGLINRDG